MRHGDVQYIRNRGRSTMQLLSDPSGKALAYRLIIILGIVSLLGDIVYEGARAVTGPFMLMLGASAFTVALVAGLGEFLGYAVRLVSGYFADRTRGYWGFATAGYLMIGAIPLLVFVGSWELAAVLVLIERIGKGIRSPAKDAILSHATKEVGRGWGFGIHEALDQMGAVAGPLVFTLSVAATGAYRGGFALLVIPFLLLIVMLASAWKNVPDPVALESTAVASPGTGEVTRLPRVFLPYGIFTFLTMAGFAVFPLIAFHYKALGVVPDAEIPVFYAIAMAVDGVVALLIGRAYDRVGLLALVTVPAVSILIPLFAFSPAYFPALLGAVLWGASMGIQETILRAAIADFTSIGKRGIAYGIFNTVYGAGWFTGSVVTGLLYETNIGYVVWFMVLMQLAALPALWWVKRGIGGGNS
jgi:MFS family permease